MNLLHIPSQKLGNWKSIPIYENGERTISLNQFAKKMRLRINPMYYKQGVDGAIPEIYLRENVIVKIEKALDLLPKNMELVIWDGWRSISTQKALFNKFKTQIASQTPDLTEEELLKITSVYVSLPSLDPLKPSPHSTGGAIDLTVAYCGGKLLEMGTEFDEFTEKANTAYYELKGNAITDSELNYRNNRRLLYSIMLEVGFTNYPEEWWHFDYGNQFWACMTGSSHAQYSNVLPTPS